MEAVNAVLGSGLRVGVLLQGKKIRDDNKTLLQTGISHDNKTDTLGFSLEPSPTPAAIRLYPEDRPGQLLCETPQPLPRYFSIPLLRSAIARFSSHAAYNHFTFLISKFLTCILLSSIWSSSRIYLN